MRKVYRGFDTAAGVEPDMWREVLRIVNSATVEGLAEAGAPPTHETGFYAALRHSNEVFAAFKVHNMGRLMASRLIGADGKLKPFGKWAEEVAPSRRTMSGHGCARSTTRRSYGHITPPTGEGSNATRT